MNTNHPYFNGKQVCKILGYAEVNKMLCDHVEKEDKKYLREFNQTKMSNYCKRKAISVTITGV